MKLNINLISHPLIQNLSNLASHSLLPSNIKNQAIKHLGLFIIYETIRKWVKVYKLTVKQIKSKKDIVIINPKESYTIIVNDLNYLSMFQEIQLLLPKVNLRLIEKYDINYINEKLYTLKNNDLYSKIIIVNQEINICYITNLIHYLITNKKINLNQVYLTCITCATSELIQLSEKYNNLTIYTTKIIKT